MDISTLVDARKITSALRGQDHAVEVVPRSERRGPTTLGLLWITMVTGFPTVFVGFEWCKSGLTLGQIAPCMALSCLILLLYTIPSCLLGAVSGQTYALLSRKVFGRWGSRFVSVQLTTVQILWYALSATFLAEGLKGLYHIPVDAVWLTVIFCLLMSVNNLFGFSGIANFARFIAAPVLVVWVLMTFVKAAAACPASVWSLPATHPTGMALTLVSTFVIGYGSWGNEADYWRYSKPKLLNTMIPVVVAVAIGQVLFPITGWMMAHLSGVTSYAGATTLMNNYAFGGITLISALVLAITLFAVNDSGLYGAVCAVQNIHEFKRQWSVLALALAGAVSAVGLTHCPHAFQFVASTSCALLPSVTVLMLTEFFIFNRIYQINNDFSLVPLMEELPAVRWPATIALLVGGTVGMVTSGAVPGLEHFSFGVCAIQAWVSCLLVYAALRPIEHIIYWKRLRAAHRILTVALAKDPLYSDARIDSK